MEEKPDKPMEIDGDNSAADPAVDASTAPEEPTPLDQNPNSPSSESDTDSDTEEAGSIEIETLESQLAENPWIYDTHVKYIHGLRKSGDIEKLRKAREEMSEKFPLTPKMWREWAQDEASLNTESEAFPEIEKLYERGVHEYLNVPLWEDYLTFVQERDQLVSQCAPDGMSKIRNLFERALTAAGLHVSEGNKIWEAYREYEQAIFLMIDENNNVEKDKQCQRIRSLFQRQLSVPLVDLESTLETYKLWEVEQGKSELDGISANVVSAFKKALDMFNARNAYENQLSTCGSSDADRVQFFKNYLRFEESSGDPARVQILYERAISELPIYAELWSGYTRYVDKTLKVPNIVKDVYSRATRNCPWIGDFWVRYILALEHLGASEIELKAVFERSTQSVFQSFEEYLELFLTRVDSLRRRMSIDGAKQTGLEYSLIRETFQMAADYFSPEMIRTEDLVHLHSYWARLEATLGKDLDAARGVWESLIKRSGSLLEVWQAYIAMEIGMGHYGEARSIYKRCYSKRFAGSGSEEICHSWLRFEREYGSLGDFDLALKKVTPRLEELEMFKTQQEYKSAAPVKEKGSVIGKTPVKEKGSAIGKTPEKRKLTTKSEKKPPAKRQKRAEPELEESHRDNPIKNPDDINDAKRTDEDMAAAINDEQQPVGEMKVKEPKPSYSDQCTAYVSNISLEANEEHLREFFVDCGGVTAIRLPKDKFTGKPRGIAYVDFLDDENLAAAIAKNKQKLLGQKLSIARSNPVQGRKKGPPSSSTSRGRGRGRGSQDRNDRRGKMETSKSSTWDKRSNEVKLFGKNTFAAPRNVKPLGYMSNDGKNNESTEPPKSNDEFRSMFLKK